MVEERMERMDADKGDGRKEEGQEGWREDNGEVRRAEGRVLAMSVMHPCACCYIGRRNALRP
jgi:hypothetical protein